jgi:hypothetical protein
LHAALLGACPIEKMQDYPLHVLGFPISMEKFQIPPDLVVKTQAIDIVEVIA